MAACVYCEEPFRQGRCLCGLTKYGMRRRALREERAEMHVLWKFLEMAGMDCMAEDFVVQELGPRTHDLYFASSLYVESYADSDPEDELRDALAGERALVEAVGNIRDIHHLQAELKRSKAEISSLEARVRSLQERLDHANDKCRPRNDDQGTGPGKPSLKRSADGEIRGS